MLISGAGEAFAGLFGPHVATTKSSHSESLTARPVNPLEKTDEKSSTDDANSEEARKLQQLKTIDRETRAHEQAHIAAGGSLIHGGANFAYEKGSDGKNYAIGGEVSIDTSVIKNDPEATITKMRTVIAAALAPVKPSAQDRSVASQASQAIAHANAQLAQQYSDTNDTSDKNNLDILL